MELIKSIPADCAWHEWTYVPSVGGEVHGRAWRDADAPGVLPLVLVAGLGVSSRYWLRIGRRLAPSGRVFAPDLPGFGRSPRVRGRSRFAGPTVAHQADELIAWMDARGLEKIVLCGHSTGGQVAVEVATRFPPRVDRLILIAPTFDPCRRKLWTYLPRLLAATWLESPSLTPLLCFEYLTAGLPRVWRQAQHSLTDPVELKLPGVRQPTLVIAGDHDTLVPEGWTDRLASKLSQHVLVSIDRVGHAPQYSAAAATAQVIDAFWTGRLSVATAPAEGAEIAPIDDPQRDPLGPLQPISPTLHGLLDYAVAAAGVVLPRVMNWHPRTRRVWTATAVASTAANLLSDHRAAVQRRIPMLAHANADVISGLHLLTAAATYLRRDKPAARLATAALGVYQIASALLTAKPTGPARVRARTATLVQPASQHAPN